MRFNFSTASCLKLPCVIPSPMPKSLNLALELEARILGLTDVVAKKSRFSTRTAFYREKREFAHFHSATEIDIRLTKAKIRALKLDYRLEISYPPRDWLVAHFEEESDLDYVFKLAQAAWKANKV